MIPLALRPRRPYAATAVLGLALTAALGVSSCTSTSSGGIGPVPHEREVWFAIVSDDVRFGSAHLNVSARADGNFEYQQSSRTLVDLFASQKQEVLVHARYVVTADLQPVSMRVESVQSSGTSVTSGQMGDDGFTVTFDHAGTTDTATIDHDPSTPLLFAINIAEWLGRRDRTAERASAWVLDEETGDAASFEATLVRRDETGSQWLVESAYSFGSQTVSIDSRGSMLEGSSQTPPIRVVRCTEQEALDLAYLVMDGPEVLSFPVDPPIELLHRLERLVVELTWRDIEFDAFELEDARQRLLETGATGDGQFARIEIAAPESTAAATNVDLSAAQRSLYLGETDYIKPTDPDILAVTREATAGAADHAEAATALSQWVFGYIEGEMIAETLSGPEVLASRKGKCTEYSTLFASMARAHGIPTRVVLGERLVGSNWMGHMWNEVWLGRWVTVDSTVNEVDGSMALLKFVHSDTVEGTQPLRWALTESLSISVEEAQYREVDLAGDFRTGIDGVTYTDVDYMARISAPEDDWDLHDVSQAGAVTIGFAPPDEDSVAIHFVAHAVPEGTPASLLMGARLAHWDTTFETSEVLSNEARDVRGTVAQIARLRGENEGAQDAIVITEVYWVRGPIAYLLTMNGWEPAQELRSDDFEALLASFRYLDE